jgi:DNA gyrase/topoisomerase IV subunit B
MDLFKIMMKFEEQQALKNVTKVSNKERVPKYLPSTEETINIFLTEGDSSISMLSGVGGELSRRNNGFFPLTGKPINSRKATVQSLSKNDVVKSLVNVLGLNLASKSIDSCTTQNIIICSDSDEGGSQIFTLLITFLFDYAPELLKQNRVKKLTLPLLTLHDKKGDMKHWIKDFPSFTEWKKTNDSSIYKTVFYKGIGKYEKSEVRNLIDVFGIDSFLEDIEYSDDLDVMLENYMGKNTEFRKERFTREDAVLDMGLL